jgi:8-oxo-dGTP pyrophosphatase MutT (NUDIX family)
MAERTSIAIESPGINLVVVKLVEDTWIFLILRRGKSETYPGFWGFLTGCRQGDETVPKLAVRELAEETSLQPEQLWATEYTIQFYEPSVDKIWMLPVLVAKVAGDAEVKLSGENDEFRWLLPSEAKVLIDWQNLLVTLENVSRELEGYPPPNWVELPIG